MLPAITNYVVRPGTEMRHPRRHSLDSRQLKQALLRAAIDTLNASPEVKVLRRPEGGSSTFTLSTQLPGEFGADRGLDNIDQITIRTSQTQWISFTRDKTDRYWKGLEETYDHVIVSSVDSEWDPKYANVHVFEVEDVIARLDKIYAAIKRAGKSIKIGAPISISLYNREEDGCRLELIGAGIGIRKPPIAKVSLKRYMSLTARKLKSNNLSIAKARRRLASSYKVPVSAVQITIAKVQPGDVPQPRAVRASKSTDLTPAKAASLIRRTQREANKRNSGFSSKPEHKDEPIASQGIDEAFGAARRNKTKVDLYRGVQNPELRLAVKRGAQLPGQFNSSDWQLMPTGTPPLFQVGGDIRWRGFCFYSLVPPKNGTTINNPAMIARLDDVYFTKTERSNEAEKPHEKYPGTKPKTTPRMGKIKNTKRLLKAASHNARTTR